jgi:hypothetical protein
MRDLQAQWERRLNAIGLCSIHQYAGNTALFPVNVGLVDDSDLNPATASALDVAPQNLADRTAWLKAHVGTWFFVNTYEEGIDNDALTNVVDFPSTTSSSLYYPGAVGGQSGIGVTGASGTPITITTGSAVPFVSNQVVYVQDVGGNTNANGYGLVNVTGSNTFQIVGSTTNAPYTSGGLVSVSYFAGASGLVAGDLLEVDFASSINGADTLGGLCVAISASNYAAGQAPARFQTGGDLSPIKIRSNAFIKPDGGDSFSRMPFFCSGRFSVSLGSLVTPSDASFGILLKTPGTTGVGCSLISDVTIRIRQYRNS